MAKVNSWVKDGAWVCFFPACRAKVPEGTDCGCGCPGLVGGAGGGGIVASLPGLQENRGAIRHPFPSMAPVSWLAPLDKGHQCLFAVLHNTNFRPQKTHDHCGLPSAASSACFWCSCLDAWFLFHASHFFSFWAAVAHFSPLVRLKKAWWPSRLRSSKMYST